MNREGKHTSGPVFVVERARYQRIDVRKYLLDGAQYIIDHDTRWNAIEITVYMAADNPEAESSIRAIVARYGAPKKRVMETIESRVDTSLKQDDKYRFVRIRALEQDDLPSFMPNVPPRT